MKCDQCGDDFIPHQSGQRFCARACSVAWYQAERRQAVEFFRANGRPVITEHTGDGEAA